MNMIQEFWMKLEEKAKKQAAELHNTLGFDFRVRLFFNGAHIEVKSNITGKWMIYKVINQL